MIMESAKAPVPHYGIGSIPKLDLSSVPTGTITRAWARSILKQQRTATDWARGMRGARDERGASPGTASASAPPPTTADPLTAIPPELVPLLRSPGERSKVGLAIQRFRFVFYCKRRRCYGAAVPSIDGKPVYRTSPFATDIEAAWFLHHTLGGRIPPAREERQRKRRRAKTEARRGERLHPYRGANKGKKGVTSS